ncbi:hypothetical protein F2P79_025829 [Pimephales promelas]|nr:hypothetical protein F2P79_025829 [Pimephales promelas]
MSANSTTNASKVIAVKHPYDKLNMRDGARCRAKWEELELKLPLFWSSSSTSLNLVGGASLQLPMGRARALAHPRWN